MGIRQTTIKYEGFYVFDDTTGEIHYSNPTTKKRANSFNKAIGVDTKYPEDCTTKESLLDALSVMDAYISDRAYINHEYILKSLHDKEGMSLQESNLVVHIANNITAWNYYIGTLADLCSSGVSSKNISTVLTKLESMWLVKILHKNKPFRGDVVLKLNPLYVWKGDLEYRSSRVLTWYGISSS